MFKLVVSLVLLAACHASLYTGGHDPDYYVQVGDNHISVCNKVGQRVHIYTDHKHIGGSGHFIQIHVSGPGVVLKSEQYVHRPVTFEGPYQTDTLYEVFAKYSGPLDEAAYERLIGVLHQHVQDGSVHPAVLYALRMLSHSHHDDSLVHPEHRQVYTAVQKLFDHGGVEKNIVLDKYDHLGSSYGHHGDGEYGLHHSYHPEAYGARDWSSQYRYPWAPEHSLSSHGSSSSDFGWSHHPYGSRYHVGSQDWSHRSVYPGLGGVRDLDQHSFGSHHLGGSQGEDWSHRSVYPGVGGVHYLDQHSFGSHHLGGSQVDDWSHRSVYPGVAGVRDWAHQSYGVHYPGHGQGWSQHSYAGPYSSGVYDSVYGHGVGQHHWGQSGSSSNW